jgi:hypothetical protein
MVPSSSRNDDHGQTLYTKDQLLKPEPDNDYIPPEMDVEAPWDRSDSKDKEALIDLIDFDGTPEFQAQMRTLCLEYADIFSQELNPEPSKLPPMELQVNDIQWKVNKNRGPARTQSMENQLETIRQVNKMVKAQVVQPSQATEYSQVLLTPKPGGRSDSASTSVGLIYAVCLWDGLSQTLNTCYTG